MAALSFDQIRQLWISNGGNPTAAPIMAAIALAESGGRTDSLNNTPSTGDYSVGLWQINYFGPLAPGRTAAYGAPAALAADPNAQAKAAIALSGNGSNLYPWSTWKKGTAQQVLAAHGGNLPLLPTLSGAGTSNPVFGVTDDEGKITMPSVIPDLSRPFLRKVVGGAVLASGAIVALAGVFVLVGAGNRLPGPLRAAQGLQERRREGQREEATVTMAARRRQREAEESFRQGGRDQLAERRRARTERQVRETRSARAAGEAAAEEAGDF